MRLFLVPEEFDLPAISLVSYIELNAPFYPRFSKEDMVTYLHLFDMNIDVHLGALSMGQKKKVFMCFALATHTSLLLMDEPTNGLDIPSKSQFRRFIASGMSDDRTILISTPVRDIDRILDTYRHGQPGVLSMPLPRICAAFRFVESDEPAWPGEAVYTPALLQGHLIVAQRFGGGVRLIWNAVRCHAGLSRPYGGLVSRKKGGGRTMKNSLSDTLFSIHRFTDLCRKEMVENWKTNAMRFVLLYGVLTVLFLWNGAYEYDRYADEVPDYLTEDPQWQIVVIFTLVCLMFSGLLSASFVMEGMRNKTGRINLLMTPATSFEKFITRWIIYTFAFLLLYLIAFKLADWTRVLFFSAVHPQLREVIAPVPPNIVLGEDARHWAVFQEVGKFRLAVSFYFFCQSLYVLGSTLWPKNAFLKTTTALVWWPCFFGGGRVQCRALHP